MNRRELIQKSAIFGLAAGVAPIIDRNKAGGQATAARSSVKVASPLAVPADGVLPVAFVLGKDAVVLDFAGPLEVFAEAIPKRGRCPLRLT